ncbi:MULTISPECIES: Uma2 family endonuclease [Calothrix]|uniref:Uma2 family endonuclease n=2 Tax=Calothrix TaxID=1186 RepID=A0ABR8A433_9CYAN|nr:MULTISPECIES: Uma2 family endonuclease [Calothrix]MBD2194108.1 Uma2 family endonuclease [Calothrix parietina FACHB-288]MBD2227515.1 Uma2 family endonuclease [Calothrix anomala FACHB-343]
MNQAQTQSQTESKLYTFDEFIAWYPENSPVRYELYDGVIVEMPKPRGKHSKLTGSLIERLLITIREMGKGDIWTIPRESIVKPYRDKSGYEPDIIILNEETISTETRWEAESVIQNASSVKLIVEVVSNNWQDDYYDKRRDYEVMGIPEYWIIDYAALGGREYLGYPKQPTIFVYELIDGEYVKTTFRENDSIKSPTFPQFNLTAQQIFDLALKTGNAEA